MHHPAGSNELSVDLFVEVSLMQYSDWTIIMIILAIVLNSGEKPEKVSFKKNVFKQNFQDLHKMLLLIILIKNHDF